MYVYFPYRAARLKRIVAEDQMRVLVSKARAKQMDKREVARRGLFLRREIEMTKQAEAKAFKRQLFIKRLHMAGAGVLVLYLLTRKD